MTGLTVATLPAVLGGEDLPEGIAWYQDLLDDSGGTALQLAVVILGFLMIGAGLFWPRFRSPRPKLKKKGLGAFRRMAQASRTPDDLHILYARIKNAKDGGGDRGTLTNAGLMDGSCRDRHQKTRRKCRRKLARPQHRKASTSLHQEANDQTRGRPSTGSRSPGSSTGRRKRGLRANTILASSQGSTRSAQRSAPARSSPKSSSGEW